MHVRCSPQMTDYSHSRDLSVFDKMYKNQEPITAQCMLFPTRVFSAERASNGLPFLRRRVEPSSKPGKEKSLHTSPETICGCGKP